MQVPRNGEPGPTVAAIIACAALVGPAVLQQIAALGAQERLPLSRSPPYRMAQLPRRGTVPRTVTGRLSAHVSSATCAE